jgi:hypothetical protein
MQTFTLWMGLNVCELLANFTGASPGLKWPNDLLFDGRKAGGMLTEARIDADQIRDLVFGLGLNVNTPPPPGPPTSPAAPSPSPKSPAQPLDLNRLAAALIGRVQLAYHTFVDGDHTVSFADLWNRYDVLRGRPSPCSKAAAATTAPSPGSTTRARSCSATPAAACTASTPARSRWKRARTAGSRLAFRNLCRHCIVSPAMSDAPTAPLKSPTS